MAYLAETFPKPLIHILSSDFLRAVETAQCLIEVLGGCEGGIVLKENLRERDFDPFDMKSNTYYDGIWAKDLTDSPEKGVESCDSVRDRCLETIREFERQEISHPRVVLLVGHGDNCQHIETFFHPGMEARYQRLKIQNVENAEWREMRVSG